MKIIDNALPQQEFEELKSTLIGGEFPWYFSDDKVGFGTNSEFNYQFTHVFFDNNTILSSYFQRLQVFQQFLNSVALMRVKANLTTPYKKVVPYDFHTDISTLTTQKYKTALYYINTTDGSTIFETGDTVDCVENRLLIFDGNLPHTGTTHTNAKYRAVINFNYFEADVKQT